MYTSRRCFGFICDLMDAELYDPARPVGFDLSLECTRDALGFLGIAST
jgi:hypothetical protein